MKYVFLAGVEQRNLHKINWNCTLCLNQASFATGIVEELEEFNQKLSKEISEVKNEVKCRGLNLEGELGEVVAEVLQRPMRADSAGAI